jgi:hypothetical protein
MQLGKITEIQSGYISRGKIEPRVDGSHLLLQARDVDADRLTYRTDGIVRFSPDLSRKDWLLKQNDLLFMARGSRNYTILIKEIPDLILAAASFFIIRVLDTKVLPDYLFWYLNQAPVDRYLQRYSGRGVHMPVVKRSVLESVDIPIPTMEVQARITKLDVLLRNEMDLLSELAEKRKKLITATCFSAVRDKS